MITPDFRVFCPGGATFYGRYFKCHSRAATAASTCATRIEKSCNVYFYTVGNMLGVDRMHKWASALGLGELSGIDLPHEIQGLMPSTEWKTQREEREVVRRARRSRSRSARAGAVTPISLAVMMMTVANGGTRYSRTCVKAVDDRARAGSRSRRRRRARRRMKQSTIDAVHDGLWMVVNAAGTGGRARIDGRDVAGKTGTAQVISLTGASAKGKMDVQDVQRSANSTIAVRIRGRLGYAFGSWGRSRSRAAGKRWPFLQKRPAHCSDTWRCGKELRSRGAR